MKKVLLALLTIMAFTSLKVNATHLMGGQITVEHLGTDSTLVRLTIYRDTTGIPMDTSAQSFEISYDSLCSAPFATILFDFAGFSSLGSGVEEYIFTKTLSPSAGLPAYLSDSSAADYYLKWIYCCRNNAIVNLTSPGSNNMVLQTRYHTVGLAGFNSTPIFLNQPVTTAEINLPWAYNPLPFDADADSLYWYLDQPWDQCQSPCAGYYLPVGLPTDPFTINPATGQITWTPTALGNWNATVMVNEYRGGQLIGFIRRDMQIIVLDSAAFASGNKPVVSINGITVQNQQQFMFTIPANQNFNLISNATDIDGDALKFTVQGEPFILSSNPATSSVVDGLGNASASISWTPSVPQARDKLYNLTLRTYEKNVSSVYVKILDITVQLKVEAFATGINTMEKNNSLLKLSPVPANQFSTLQFSSKENESTKIMIHDLFGRVMNVYTVSAKAGINVFMIPTLDLSNGMYMITLQSANTKSSTKILVQH